MSDKPDLTKYYMVRELLITRGVDGGSDERSGLLLDDILALSKTSDPYNFGGPTDVKHAQWFADLWREHGHGQGTHLRRMHYRAVVAATVKKPDGSTYENTEKDADFLNSVSKPARAFNLVDAGDFVDRRNPEPILAPWVRGEYPDLEVDLPDVPEFPLQEIPTTLPAPNLEIPSPFVMGFERDDDYDRPYIVEVWIEKTTMNDILEPLCAELRVNLVPAAGVQSITSAINLLKRCHAHQKPGRVFYVSDFDPQGKNMPMTVSREVEFYLDRFALDADIKLMPVALTHEQTKGHRASNGRPAVPQLPRTPIKDKDPGRARFESLYGGGAVELDALEAIRPGELARLVREAVEPYLDHTIDDRLEVARAEASDAIHEAWNKATADIQDELHTIGAKAATIAEEFEDALVKLNAKLQAKLAPLKERRDSAVEQLREVRDNFEYPEFERPEPQYRVGNDDAFLFDSGREYMQQMAYYQRYKGAHAKRGRRVK